MSNRGDGSAITGAHQARRTHAYAPICTYIHPYAPIGKIASLSMADLVVYNPKHYALWPCLDIHHALCYSQSSQAIERIMTHGKWRFDGSGSLAHRIAQHPNIVDWRREADLALKQLLTDF